MSVLNVQAIPGTLFIASLGIPIIKTGVWFYKYEEKSVIEFIKRGLKAREIEM